MKLEIDDETINTISSLLSEVFPQPADAHQLAQKLVAEVFGRHRQVQAEEPRITDSFSRTWQPRQVQAEKLDSFALPWPLGSCQDDARGRTRRRRNSGEQDMGLKHEVTTILTKLIEGPFVAEALSRQEAAFEPLVNELRKLAVEQEFPKSVPPLEFPTVALIEHLFRSHAKKWTAPLPLRVRKRIHEVFRDIEDDFLAESTGKTALGVPWDSDVVRLLRLVLRNLQAAGQSVLTPEEKHTLELEILVEEVTQDRDKKARFLEAAQRRIRELEVQTTHQRDALERVTRESAEKDRATYEDFIMLKQEIGDLERKFARQHPRPRPSENAPNEPTMTKSQLALGQLQAAVYGGKVVNAPNARYLSQTPFSTLYRRLQAEGVLERDPDELWKEQVSMLMNAFANSEETYNSLRRKTGLDVDTIKSLLQGRARPRTHVNSVVRLAATLNVHLAGITSYVEKSPDGERDEAPYDHSDHKLH